jgi:Tfp pilus assembly PilM family ATPase
LQRIFIRMNIKDQTPVASVSGKGISIRYVDMPRMSLLEVKKSFKYEVDKYFPFDPKSIYTDCYILNPKSEGKMMLLVVAVKKELVDERIKLFKEIGVELSYVTTNSIATANAFENALKAQGNAQAKAILDIGVLVSSLMILDNDDSPCFTRDIFIGSQHFSNEAIENLVKEIQLSFDYLFTEKNIPVNELYLSGEEVLLKTIVGPVEKNLKIPVKIWNPLIGLHLGPEVVSSEIEPFSSQLGVAVGLALTKI